MRWHLGYVSVAARSFGDAIDDSWNRWRLTDQRQSIFYYCTPSIYFSNTFILMIFYCFHVSEMPVNMP
jgi:hypothetical protein